VEAQKKRRVNRLGDRWVPPGDKFVESDGVAAESVPKVMEVEADSSDEELSLDEEDSKPTNPTLSSPPLNSQSTQYTGLEQPSLDSGAPVTGESKKRHRVENKWKRRAKQVAQGMAGLAAVASKSYGVSYWAKHQGLYKVPTPKAAPPSYRGQMCPQNLALDHPAADVLKSYSQQGCPVNTGKKWTMEMWEAMIEKGPHISALEPDAIKQMQEEVATKVKAKQCEVVEWEWLKSQPRETWEQLKISPIAMVPHKSRKYRAILDLSFSLKLKDGGVIQSVNDASVKTAPKGAIDQLGQSLDRIIHAMAQADEDDKVFMAKWDIKDGFWRLDCQDGEEWNFAYVLPQEDGKPVKLVVPTSLQMGWIESPPYFCAASETGRDVAQQYAEAPVGSLENHKFIAHALQGEDYATFQGQEGIKDLQYMIEVYMDDYISMAIPRSKEDLQHVANAVMKGVHDVFPEDEVDQNDPISYKKLLKLEAMWSLTKDILGFTFDGDNKTIWLEDAKREVLLKTLKQWLRQARRSSTKGIPFEEFRKVISKLRHAFISIPAGKGLLSPCNTILRIQPKYVLLNKSEALKQAITDCRTLLRVSTKAPTKCKELVAGWPDFVGVKDASGYGVGGFIVGENKACIPTVFRFEWPQDIRDEIISESNPNGKLTNSDLECAGLLMLWLVMEDVCNIQSGDHVALFSDNSPTVSWVQRLAAKSSKVAQQLIRALALRLKVTGASPLSALHISGVDNQMTDIPSRSFGTPAKWHYKSDLDLLTFYNQTFPLNQQQNSWSVYQVGSRISTLVLSVLRTKLLDLDVWCRLPKPGQHIGVVGMPSSHRWASTLIYRTPHSPTESGPSQASPSSSETGASIVEREVKSELRRLVALSQPLERRSLWPLESTQPRTKQASSSPESKSN